MSDDLIYWSYCSPVRVRAKQVEPKVEVKTYKACPRKFHHKPFKEHPHFMEQSQNALLLQNISNQQQGHQQGLLSSLFGSGLGARGIFGGNL